MNLLQKYQKAGNSVMQIFKWDLQLHFFWGFVLTLLGLYWQPFYAAGIAVTLIKEALDLWSKKHWSWGDFWCGIFGSISALIYLYAGYKTGKILI